MNELIIEMSNGKTITLNSDVQEQLFDNSLFDNIGLEEMKFVRESIQKFLDPTNIETAAGTEETEKSEKVILRFEEKDTNPEMNSDLEDTVPSDLLNSIDMSNLTSSVIKGGLLDLKNESFSKLMITLEDVMRLDSGKNIIINGTHIDKLIFKDTVNSDGSKNEWSFVCDTNHDTNMSEYIYTNSGDSSLQIRVEQLHSDGITL